MGVKNLVIVESPAKAKTIAKYLNGSKALRDYGKFVVMSSKGHIRDLKNRELSIDIEKDFEPHYEVMKDKVTLVKELKEKAKQVEHVYLAADFDREGEAISEHIRETLGLKKYFRITFTEITQKALENAVKSPRQIDNYLVDAQETRRVLDRLVGFKISPLLWKTYNANKIHLSAGRVQSAVLHILKEREVEIQNFTTGAYWYFQGNFTLSLENEKHEIEDVKLYDSDRVFKIDTNLQDVQKYIEQFQNKFSIMDLKIRQMKQNADLPFITSTLQQEAYSKHGFPLKRTMALAQDLYEKGYITYMRTDSYNISEDFKQDAEKFIVQKYGLDYYEGLVQKKSKKSKNAQEAHEAIRPTHLQTMVIDELGFTVDHKKLYDMIWKRTAAYFMKAAIFDELEIKISDSGIPKTAYFQASFKKTKFNGHLILYGVQNDIYNFEKYIDIIKRKKYNVLCHSVIAKNTWSNPPARFSEASIIKTLESESIGRPSTFATMLSKLFEKHYVMKSDVRGEDKKVTHIKYIPTTGIKHESDTITIGHERSKLIPSDIGLEIDGFMEKNFNYIIDKRFTATMEEDLDKIANGIVSRSDVLKSFWHTFGEDVNRIETQKKAEKIKIENENLAYIVDGKEYIVRVAKYGPVVQYQNGDQTKYIDIKSYLKYTNKSYTNITEEDVRFLISLPQKIATINGLDVMLTAGPYGLYFKYNEQNIKIPLKFIKKLLDPELKETITIAEYASIIAYKDSKKESKKDNKTDSRKGGNASISKNKHSDKVSKKKFTTRTEANSNTKTKSNK
jgi:DNA topoisomerase-1